MDHGTLQQLAAGAALDDLDAAERVGFDAHLAMCASCTALTAELDGVLADLALVAPELRPPASLKLEVLSALRAPVMVDLDAPTAAASPAVESPVAAPPTAEPVVDLAERRRWRAVGLAGLGMAAVLAIAAVGLGSRVTDLDGQVAAARVLLAEAQAEAAARNAALTLIATPDHVTAALHAEPVAPDATAMVVFQPGSEESYLMAAGLPATPEGQVYQLWYADAGGVHPLGTFHHDGNGPFVAPFGVDLGSSAAAMVTLEPEGGAQGEPGPQVIFGEF
jgi:Anti-sigma-K factor rskA